MPNQPFIDQLAITLARSRVTRRKAVAGGLALAATADLTSFATKAQEATPAPPSANPGFGQAFLFVQTFTGGTFTANPAAGTPVAEGTPEAGVHGAYVLSLGGHPGQTVYFSDRPERIVGDAPTDQFVAGLGFGASNPPNAALVIENEDGQTVVTVVELLNPVVDLDGATVSYEANLLDDYETGGFGHLIDQKETNEVPAEFGSASLYIDDCPPVPVWCYPEGAQCCPDTGCTPTWIDHSTMGGCWSWSKFDCLPCNNQSDWCNDHYGRCNDTCFGLDHDCQPPT